MHLIGAQSFTSTGNSPRLVVNVNYRSLTRQIEMRTAAALLAVLLYQFFYIDVDIRTLLTQHAPTSERVLTVK